MNDIRDPEDHSNPPSMRDPSKLSRTLGALLYNRMVDPKKRQARRVKAEAKRQRKQQPHTLEYFHQADDPYSHLAVQKLGALLERYDVDLKVHLMRGTGGKSQPLYDELAEWARRDASLVATHYGVSFPDNAPTIPPTDLLADAECALAKLSLDDFVTIAPKISEALWSGDSETLGSFAKTTRDEAIAAVDQGSRRLKKLHHYSGAMFFYSGEWYWGTDRIDHLEQHLRENGAAKGKYDDLIVTRPLPDVEGVDASDLTLHFYPSLNSPYTSIIYDQSIALREECGINLLFKPVLPMIMRGVPATLDKILYIFFDTKREAERNGVPFGPCLSPIGKPVINAYSLLPWAKTKGLDEALLGELLRRAFSQAARLDTEEGLRAGVEAVGLDWEEAKIHMGSDDWRAIVADNQDEMIKGMGLWGVPSYRLEGPGDEPPLSVWGQDRLWVITEEIKRRARMKG